MAALAVASAGLAAASEYFPLAVGNSWMYQSDGRVGRDTRTIAVTETQVVEGRTYYKLSAFGRTPLIRSVAGDLMEYDAGAGSDKAWLELASGGQFVTGIEQCTSGVQVLERRESLSTAFGDFDNVLHVAFQTSCADAGLTDMWLLPHVGILRYATTTIAGPRVYDLAAFNTGAVEFATALVSTKLALNSGSYKADPGNPAEMTARLTVRGSEDKPLVLNFSSGQRFDLAVKDGRGEVLLTWSSNKLFLQALGTEVIGPGTEKTWTITLPLDGIAPGKYIAEAWLTTSDTPPKAYSASVPFEVVE